MPLLYMQSFVFCLILWVQEKFAAMIADAGFQKVEYENLVGGVVAIHSGLKFWSLVMLLSPYFFSDCEPSFPISHKNWDFQ